MVSDTEFELSSLSPFSNYAARLQSVTSAGRSNQTDWLLLNTTEDGNTMKLGISSPYSVAEGVFFLSPVQTSHSIWQIYEF